MEPQSFIGFLVYILGGLFLLYSVGILYSFSQLDSPLTAMSFFGYDSQLTSTITIGILILGFGKIIESVEKRVR